MKKISLLFIFVGILFSSLGGKLFVEIEKEIEREKREINNFTLFVNDTFNNQVTIIDKEKILSDYGNRIKKVEKSLNRKDYNSLIKDINKLQYDELKDELITKVKKVETKIKKKEDKEKKKKDKKNASKKRVYGNVSAYTPYCSDGCKGYTASGRFIGKNIYYNDKTYGKVRIIAADKSYPFGTIIRFNNLNYFGKKIYAIVLDRGGAIGNGKRIMFDLLFKTEKEANNFGIAKNVSCDVLRLGY